MGQKRRCSSEFGASLRLKSKHSQILRQPPSKIFMYNCPINVGKLELQESINLALFVPSQNRRRAGNPILSLDIINLQAHVISILPRAASVQPVGPAVLLQVCLGCFLDSQVRNQLVFFQRFTGHWVETAHLEMKKMVSYSMNPISSGAPELFHLSTKC